MDLATLSEAARSLGPGASKPTLPAPPRAIKSDPFLPPPPVQNLPDLALQPPPGEAQTNLQGTLFSPLFQCNTTLPFYAALLNELQAMATLVDPCPAVVREIIWEHVFLLIGVNPQRCDVALKPIIEAWLSAPTVNLLAVELLYIAFVRALANHPDLLRTQAAVMRTPHYTSLAAQNNSHPVAASSATTTFVQRPFKRYTGGEIRELPQPKPKAPQVDSETSVLNSRYLTPPNANPVTATEVYLLLRVWAPQLDTMPHEARDALHTLLRAHPSFASMRELPLFSHMTAAWAAEPVRHFEAAALLFLAVGFLKAIKKIPIECFDPRRMQPVFSSGDELANLSFKKYVTISQHEVS